MWNYLKKLLSSLNWKKIAKEIWVKVESNLRAKVEATPNKVDDKFFEALSYVMEKLLSEEEEIKEESNG